LIVLILVACACYSGSAATILASVELMRCGLMRCGRWLKAVHTNKDILFSSVNISSPILLVVCKFLFSHGVGLSKTR
jgi:hypothetical protein